MLDVDKVNTKLFSTRETCHQDHGFFVKKTIKLWNKRSILFLDSTESLLVFYYIHQFHILTVLCKYKQSWTLLTVPWILPFWLILLPVGHGTVFEKSLNCMFYTWRRHSFIYCYNKVITAEKEEKTSWYKSYFWKIVGKKCLREGRCYA